MMDERQSIKDSLRCLRKYGSTSSNSCNKIPDEFIKHIVTDTDTLQGIALKYGVTTEQIRRANKLWANDSLFLRESLLIPVMKSKSLPSTSISSFDSPTESDLFLNQSIDDVKPVSNGVHKADSVHSSASSCKNDDDLDSYNDFLNRIDADIANKAQQVKLTQDKSLFASELNGSSTRRKPAMSRLKQQQQQQQRQYNSVNSYEMPSVVTHGKTVRNSLQRLQEKQEEIFEL